MIRVIALGALALAGLVAAVPARGETTASPRLALALVTGASQPRLKLEQRAIERSWGLSEDSVYREVDVPGWRSEGAAAAMSAVVAGRGGTPWPRSRGGRRDGCI